MNIPSWKTRLAAEAGEYLDADTLSPAEPADDSPTTNERDEKYLADLQLVDALLETTTPAAIAKQNQLIEGAMRTLSESATATLPSSRQHAPSPARSIRRSALAVAACLMVAISIFWIKDIRETHAIESALHEIATAASKGEQRVYKVSRRTSDSDQPAKQLGELYLKGNEAFVLDCKEVVLGRTDKEFWLVCPSKKVFVAQDFNWLIGNTRQQQQELTILREIAAASGHVSLVDLSMVTELMRHEYSLELQRHQTTPNKSTTQLSGTRNSASAELPSTIRIWADSETFIIQQAEFSWNQDESTDSAVVMQLIDSPTVPEGWYRRESHHSSDQPIQFLSPRE